MKKSLFSVLLATQIIMVSFQIASSQVPVKPSSSLLNGSWQVVGTAGFSASNGCWAQLKTDLSGKPWVVYSDWPGSLAINVMNFNGSTWTSVGQTGHTGDFSTMALTSTGVPYVAFCEFTTEWASVLSYNNSTWDYTGNPSFSAGVCYHTYIAMSPSDEPYVVYQDAANSSKLSVMKYNGSAWDYVGLPGFTAYWGDNPVMGFSPSGEPWVACGNLATVMKFDGTSWNLVGIAGFSQGFMDSISLAFSPSGQAYVAYSDGANGWKATVMKFDGTQWVNVGNAGFSAGTSGYECIAFSPEGMPVVAFQDGGHGNKASVMTFDGSQWSYVGDAGFSTGGVNFTTIAFAPNGTLYIAFCDSTQSYRVTVMEYDGYTGVQEKQQPSVLLYPNPVVNNLTIRFSGLENLPKTIQIYNQEGINVATFKSSDTKVNLDLSNYSSGLYCIKISSGQMDYFSKIIKN